MTHVRWLMSSDSRAMLGQLGPAAGERKLRLFVCACFRRVEDQLGAPEVVHAVFEAVERFADGANTEQDVRSAGVSPPHLPALIDTLRLCCTRPMNVHGAEVLTQMAVLLSSVEPTRGQAERRVQCDLLRDIFGDPFRPFVFDPAWCTPAVEALARVAYDEGRFDLLPILGDALEDTGCDRPAILNHCRSAGPHVRGCWVVDAVLGRE